jgi:hypothetical protein
MNPVVMGLLATMIVSVGVLSMSDELGLLGEARQFRRVYAWKQQVSFCVCFYMIITHIYECFICVCVVLKQHASVEHLTAQRDELTIQLSNASSRHRILKKEKDLPTHLDKKKFAAILLLRKSVSIDEWDMLDKYMRCGINYIKFGNLRDELIARREVVVEALELLEDDDHRPAGLERVDSLSEGGSQSQ